MRGELAPHILDVMAFYFYKMGKNMSAMTYTRQALEAHTLLGNLDNECIAQLHVVSTDLKEASSLGGWGMI